jgi:hypothetical protein
MAGDTFSALVDADEIVIGEVQSHGVDVVLDLFEKPLVSRVKRRMCIRIVRFWRSTYDVETWRGSGRPAIRVRKCR